jgi:hypothetical protein
MCPAVVLLMSMPALRKPRASMVGMATVLVCISAALAQSVPDAPQSVAAAVASIGVVALGPAADASAPASMAGRLASINGSGFFVRKQGHVITALHVVRAAVALVLPTRAAACRLLQPRPWTAGYEELDFSVNTPVQVNSFTVSPFGRLKCKITPRRCPCGVSTSLLSSLPSFSVPPYWRKYRPLRR